MAHQKFQLTSDDFHDGDVIPKVHTCEGKDTPPALKWSDPPAGAKSFALILDDPDAPRGTFTHWVVFDLSADARQLPAAHDGTAGINDFHKTTYGGPCPPVGHGEHRYFFRLFALDVDSLLLPARAKRNEVESAMQGHVLAETHLMGRYARNK